MSLPVKEQKINEQKRTRKFLSIFKRKIKVNYKKSNYYTVYYLIKEGQHGSPRRNDVSRLFVLPGFKLGSKIFKVI